MKEKILNWIEEQKQAIIDPGNEGITEQERYENEILNEAEQAQLNLLDELQAFIKGEN